MNTDLETTNVGYRRLWPESVEGPEIRSQRQLSESYLKRSVASAGSAKSPLAGFDRSTEPPASGSSWLREVTTAVAPVINPKDAPRIPFFGTQESSFIALHLWEGYVTDVSAREFGARLVDLVTGVKEDAIFPIETVSDDDRELIKPGAEFYWSIGLGKDSTRRVHTTSELRFRRLLGPSEAEIAEEAKRSRAISESLGFYSKA